MVVRAAPGPDEPHDIYLVIARLSPDGVLLGVGRAYNLTETSAVDEQPPVGQDGWFAFVEQPLGDDQPSRFRLVDLMASPDAASASWTPLQKLQASLTRLQKTGRLGETRFVTYAVPLDTACAAYCKTILAMPEMKEWIAAALKEADEIEELDMEF